LTWNEVLLESLRTLADLARNMRRLTVKMREESQRRGRRAPK